MVPEEYNPKDSIILTEFEDMQDLCKNLISLEGKTAENRYHPGQRVALSHFSVKEYLISDSDLDPTQCHHLLADVCLTSLGLNSFLKNDWINISASLAINSHIILKRLSYCIIAYAMANWHFHIQALSKISVAALESTAEYFLRAFSKKKLIRIHR